MLVTLTTDFGIQDGYVGVMKGVMATIAPGTTFIDITHDILPQDVRSAAYVLWTMLPYFPSQSVHLAVVDPGVGTSRRPLAARTPWGLLVGPDNGIFSYVWHAAPPNEIVALANPQYQRTDVSHTFHGRDIFAPAAAHLARGVPLKALGPVIDAPVLLPLPGLEEQADGTLRGAVVYIDHFGNAVTSIGRLIWEGAYLHLDAAFGAVETLLLHADKLRVFIKGRDLGPIRPTYGAVAPGEPLALIGSEGMLEVAVSQGHGAGTLELNVGDIVELVRQV